MNPAIKARAGRMRLSFMRPSAGFALCLLFVLPATPARAQAVYDVITNLWTNTRMVPVTIELMAYILGLYALYSGLMALKETSQEPGKKPIRPAVIRFVTAAALIALPRTVAVTVKSMNATEFDNMRPVPKTRLMNGL